MENQNKTLMGILAYLGPLVIIPLLASKDPFVKFHTKQGLVLIVLGIILWILMPMFWMAWNFWWVAKLIVLVFTVLGIMNVIQGKEKELPLIGQFAKHFTF